MRKTKFSIRLTSLMLVFMILFSLWNPSMFALGEKDQGEEEQDKPMQVEVINEDKEEDGSDQDQEEVKKDLKEEESEEEKKEEELKEEPKEEEKETPQPEKDKAEEPKKEEKTQDKNKENKEEEVKKEEKPQDKKEENKDEIEEEVDQGPEYYPSVLEPAIPLPRMLAPMSRVVPLNSGLEDTIEVNKWAERIDGLCRVYEVTLEITGTPQQAPVDVVLIIDRSGSMNDSTGNDYGYHKITSNPANSGTYYVKVNGQYKLLSRVNVGTWNNSIYRWAYTDGGNRYVEWDFNGDDSSPGNTDSNNPVAKPFYVRGSTRLYHAKSAAINFASKVLGPSGIPGSRVSIVSFNGPTTSTGLGSYGVPGHAKTEIGLSENLLAVAGAINGISATGGTNTEAGFNEGKKVIQNSTDRPNSNKVVIMFTDGMPTSSNGNAYGPNNPTQHNSHTIAAYQAGQSIFQNNIADVFTVGLLQGLTGNVLTLAKNTLQKSQNKGYYEAPTASDLDAIFNSISTQLGYAATNAKVVDEIGEHFDLIESSLPTGATYDSATRKITWNPGTIVDEETLTYQVKAKSNFVGGPAYTNEFARLTYTDIFGTSGRTKDFPKPQVDVPALLELILTDASIILGDSINLGEGTDSAGQNYMGISGGDGDGTYTYEWRVKGSSDVISTERTPQVTPTEDTEYELTVTDSNGCKAVATMWVSVRQLKVTVKKVIDGNYADYDRTFNFNLWINDVEQSGFSLGNNQEKTFENISKNSTIKLKEESEDYGVTVMVGSQEIFATDGVYTIPVGEQDITIEVTNHKDAEIDTGISTDSLPYILVLALAGAVLGFMIIRRRKFNN